MPKRWSKLPFYLYYRSAREECHQHCLVREITPLLRPVNRKFTSAAPCRWHFPGLLKTILSSHLPHTKKSFPPFRLGCVLDRKFLRSHFTWLQQSHKGVCFATAGRHSTATFPRRIWRCVVPWLCLSHRRLAFPFHFPETHTAREIIKLVIISPHTGVSGVSFANATYMATGPWRCKAR